MDKKTPTYDLEAIKESVRENGAYNLLREAEYD